MLSAKDRYIKKKTIVAEMRKRRTAVWKGTFMVYDKGHGEDKNWILAEGDFDTEYLAKCESVMCQGNGYMCVRAAQEEICSDNIGRYTLVAGTFDKLPEDACNELVNSADFTAMTIEINGERVTPEGRLPGTYERELNLRTGLLCRKYVWVASDKSEYRLSFERVVSLKDKHLTVSAVSVHSLGENSANVKIITGIDGDTIKKADHFKAVDASFDDGVMLVSAETQQSGILFTTASSVTINAECNVKTEAKGKSAIAEIEFELPAGRNVILEKRSVVYTNRDRERDGCSLFCLEDTARRELLKAEEKSFDEIADESAAEWKERIWDERDVLIDSENDTDQLAIRFAIYHLTVMAPVHDNRMNIGAKGLSGPGYYGHAFWDTENYMLPYFIFTAPWEARSLCEYRYNSIEAARRYAREAGCEGARYPWEAAWITDGECTPTWCDTGDLELHITSDVAFGAYYYYMVTGDEDFMDRSGYELILDCAKFWATKVEYNKELDRYEINDVIGPNEYKAHVNNNAYTNYLAHSLMKLAMEYTEKLRSEKLDVFERLNKLLELDRFMPIWKDRCEKIYLPRENADGIIPEDDTFLTLPDPTVSEYSASTDPGIRERLQKTGYMTVQLCKQADVVALLFMMEDLFSAECKKKNFYYYEHHCLHDSSLSLATFSSLAADLHEDDMAYALFERATMIDMCDWAKSSDAGMHAASLGGMWQCCVFGFGGVRRYGDELRIQPNLPKEWNSVSFCIWWQGQRLSVTATHEYLSVENLTGTADVQFLHDGELCSVGDGITIKL